MRCWDDYGRTWRWEQQAAQKANREDRTRCCNALCLDHLEGRENLHYDKRTLVAEAFVPSTRYSGWIRSGNRFCQEAEVNHACEVENADGRPMFPPGGILELVTCTLVEVVIALGRLEIAARARSEDGGREENASQSEP